MIKIFISYRQLIIASVFQIIRRKNIWYWLNSNQNSTKHNHLFYRICRWALWWCIRKVIHPNNGENWWAMSKPTTIYKINWPKPTNVQIHLREYITLHTIWLMFKYLFCQFSFQSKYRKKIFFSGFSKNHFLH